jgi:DNA-directed RNA polymerase delta subunit
MARDKDTGIVKKAPVIVDEQTKAAAKREAAKGPTPDEALLANVQAQIAKLQKRIDDAPLDLNKPVNKMTPEELKAFQKARVDAQRVAREDVQSGENPDNPMPSEDPGPGMYWANYGGVWRKYKYVTNTSTTDNNNAGNNNNSGNNNTATTDTNITLVSTETDEYGNVIGVYSDSSTKILIPSGKKYKSTVDEDAYSILESTFKDFGLEELVPEIKKFMDAGLGSNQAGVELRKTAAYTTRFKGNETRRASGLNVLSEAEYLALEDSYSQTLRAYGLQNYFGIDRKVKTASMADIIGNDISAIEFKDRIDTVVTRINNADPKIKNTLNAFYNITDTDLVKYFLNPKENLPKLQEKVTAAEIGSAALSQGLVTDVNRATALAQMGITKEKAQEGYEAISGALPTTTKLSQIYGEEGINYTQATAEEEVFKQLESAKRKRLKLAEKEVGSFSGAAGLGRNALGTGKSSAF